VPAVQKSGWYLVAVCIGVEQKKPLSSYRGSKTEKFWKQTSVNNEMFQELYCTRICCVTGKESREE